jgi:ribosomal subunit interface protein
MKLPVHIQFHGMSHSEAIAAHAREHANKLELFSPDIIACRVTVDLEQKHQQQGRPFDVRLDLTLPGHELVVNRVRHEDVYVALRDAFDNMRRQLEDVVRRTREQEEAVTTQGVLMGQADSK